MKAKRTKIVSLMLTTAMTIGALPMMTASAASAPVFSDDFNAETTKWYKDPLLVPEEDETGNMLTIEGETGDNCAQIGVSPALTTGLYELSFEFKPASGTKSWFNIFNGSSLVHTIIAAIPDGNGTLTIQTGRYADASRPAAKIATGMAADAWYDVKAVIDIGDKKIISVEVTDDSGKTYTHSEYKFDAYATTWKTGTQIDRLGLYTGSKSTTDRPYMDNVVIQEYKAPFDIEDSSFTISDADGNVSSDWSAVLKGSKNISVDFGKNMDELQLTAENIFIENVTASESVAYSSSYADGIFSMTLTDDLIPGNTYNVTVKKGIESTDGYVLASDKVITFTVAEEVEATDIVFGDNFNAATTKWYKDPLLVPEEDGTGNMLTIEGETGDNCAQIGVSPALTTGLYELSFEFKPASGTKSWFNIFNGSSLVHTVIAAIPDGNGTLTIQTGRYADTTVPGAKIATGMATDAWYDVKAVIDIGNKKVISVEVTDDSGKTYTHSEYKFDAYATTWKTGTQIDRLGLYTGSKSTTDRPYIDNVVIQEYKAPFELTDESITMSDSDGNVSADWNAVIKESNQINIDFGKEIVASDLTTDNIVIENVTAGSTVPYTATFENNIYKISLSTALIPENEYKVTVKKGIESTDGYVLGEDKVITFIVAKTVEVTDSVFSDNFDAATTTWYKDPLLVPEEDGSGNMMTIEGETADRCSMKGITALTSGLYEFSFDFKPASETKSWFNIYNGSVLYHTLIATIPDENGKLTFLTGRSASDTVATARIATGMETGKWYKVKAVVDAGAKKVVSVELITEDGASYTHGEYVFDAYATTWKEGTQIDRIAIHTGVQSTTDRPYIDNVLIKEYKYSISIDDTDFTIYDVNGQEQEDWTNVSADTKTVEIDFGKDMVESDLTTDSIVVKDLEGNSVEYTGSYADQVYTISFNKALTEGMTYTVKVNAGLKSEEGYIVNSSKTIEFTVALPEVDEDVVLEDKFNYISSSDCKWYKDRLIVTEEDGTGGMLTIGGTTNEKAAQLGVAPALTSGMYEISYKFKPSISTPTYLSVMNGSSLYHTIVSAIPDGSGTVTLQTGRPADANQAGAIIESGMPANAWYDVKAVVDISRKRIATVSITDKAGNEYTHAGYNFDTYAQTWKTGTQIDRISFNGTATSETDRPYLEDLMVKVYYQTPELGADSVVLYAGESVQEDYQNVNPLTNKITLDFGTGMDETTLNNTNIKIVDKDSNNVSATISYADRVCTITLPDGLAPSSEYTLSVSGAVLNKKGTAILNPYSLTFKTTKATLKAPITGIKLSGADVTALSQLSKDAQLDVEFAYENSTNSPAKIYVIVSYYQGNVMKTADFITKEFTTNEKMGTYTVPHTVRDLTDVDLIRVMVWDGLESIHPLSLSVDIDNVE